MHYYVDGYNLMFRTSGAYDDLASRRQQLIEELNFKTQLLDLEVTLVFDSQYQPGQGDRSHFQNLEILFTDEGETADECIVNEIKSEKYPASKITVVTSDKKLAWFARRCRATTVSTEEFIVWLNKRCRNRLRKRTEPITKPKVVPKAPSPTPKKTDDDYYLEEFQSRLLKLEAEQPQPPKKAIRKSKQKRKKLESPPDDDVSKSMLDMERWLYLFEKEVDSSQ